MTHKLEESPKDPVNTVPTKLMLIGGRWVESSSSEWREVVTPSRRGEVLARVPRGNAKDVDLAVQAARRAFPAWRDQHFTMRQRALLKIADAIEAQAEPLAHHGG